MRTKRCGYTLSLAELDAQFEAEEAKRLAAHRWGGWTLEVYTLELVFTDNNGCKRYRVDLERCSTSAAVLDWIIQVSKKVWSRPKHVGDLVRALDDIFDLQSQMCSGALLLASKGRQGAVIDCTAFLRQRYGGAAR
jgi:hypothetical protein